jgi:hypothetical protein
MPPIDPRPNILRAPHDAGGSGSEAPAARADIDTDATAPDRYTAATPPKPIGQRTFRLPMEMAGRAPSPKRLKRLQISEALKRTAEGITLDDPTGVRRDEAKQVLPHALEYIVNHFKPEKTPDGAPPPETLVRRALRSAYRTVFPGRKVDKDDAQIEHLVAPFSALLNHPDIRFTLGLSGRKAKTRTTSAKIKSNVPDHHKLSALAARIVQSRKSFEHIRELWAALNRAHLDGRIGAAAMAEVNALYQEAGEIAAGLRTLREHAPEIESALLAQGDAGLHNTQTLRLTEIAALLSFHVMSASSDVDATRIEHFAGVVRADRDAWIARHAPAFHDELSRTLQLYLRFWLAEQAGDIPPGMQYSETALNAAIAGAGRTLPDDDAKAHFRAAAHRMIASLVRRESIRSRLNISTKDEGAAIAPPPMARHIANRAEFARVIGDELFASFNASFQRLQTNARGGEMAWDLAPQASAFYELFIHYMRYAANVYGEHFGPDLLRANGLEPRLLIAIYSRVEAARSYGQEPVEMLRAFFAEHVTDQPIPPLAELMPSGMPMRTHMAHDDRTRFVDYDDGMAMQQYLENMPFDITPEFREAFERRVGYSFDAFRRWGSVRRRPKEKTQEEWDAEVENAAKRGHLENVTQEPRTEAALDAMLPAFWFLHEMAAEQGMAVDAWDFLAAIYPVARRMRASAVDGVITVTAPAFMRNLPFRNWGYSTFARQIVQSELATNVVRSTLESHANGEVIQPEYWDIRRYSVPLAEISNGGLEQERLIYEFAAGLMRFAPLLDTIGQVFDSGGGLATFAPAGMPTRFSVQLEEDPALYVSGHSGPEPGAQRTLLLNVRHAAFGERIAVVREYLQELRALPVDVHISWSDGTPADAGALSEQLLSYIASHHYYKALLMDRSTTSSTRSAADLREISNFYTAFGTFRERIMHLLRARGMMPSRRGPIPFEAGLRIAGRTSEAERWGRVTLFPGDAFNAARRYEWNRERRDDLLRMQVYAGRAIAHGDLHPQDASDASAVAKAALAFWIGDERALERAANDYAAIAQEPTSTGAEESPAFLGSTRPSEAVSRLREPVLPPRRRAESWSAQWMDAAHARGLEDESAALGTGIMVAYFAAVRGFHARFWGGVLGDIVTERAQALGADGQRELIEAIRQFFGTIGVANGERNGGVSVAEGESLNGRIAQWAAEDYLDTMPSDPSEPGRVPIHDALLRDIIRLHCMNHREEHPEPSVIMLRTRQIIEEYNSKKPASAGPMSAHKARLPSEGLLLERLAASTAAFRLRTGELEDLRQAYFRLYDSVRNGQPVSEAEASTALTASGARAQPHLVASLRSFIGEQQRDLAAWRTLVADPELGFPAFVHRTFRSPYVTDEALVAFANEYAGDRLTLVVPTDPEGLSNAVVADAFSLYPDISARLAASYRERFHLWSEQTLERLDSRLGLMRIALDEIADDDVEPPDTPAELVQYAREQAADAMAAPSFDWREDERYFSTLRSLLGKPPRTSIEEIALDLFITKTLPAKDRKNARVERELQAAQHEIDTMLDLTRAAQTHAQNIVLGFREPADISALSAEGLERFIRAANRSEHEARAFIVSMDEYAQFGDRLEAFSRDYGHDVALDNGVITRIRQDLAETREQMEQILQSADSVRATAHERLSFLEARNASVKFSDEAQSVRTQVLDVIAMAEHMSLAVAELTRRISDMASDAERFALDLVDLSGDADAAFETATREGERMQERTRIIAEELEDIRTSLMRLLQDEARDDAPAGMLTAAVASLNASRAFVTDEEIEEQIDLLAKLDEAATRSQTALASIPVLQERLAFPHTIASKAINDAEARIPAGSAAGIPESTPLPETDGLTSISPGEPKKKSNLDAQKLLAPFLGGRVLTVGNASHFLTNGEAERAKAWLSGTRGTAFSTMDFLGNTVNVSAGQRGARLFSISELPDDHPFARLRRIVALALSENSMEATILAYLGRPKNHALLLELLVYLFTENEVADVPEARMLIRAWSLAHAQRLQDAIGPGADRIFVTPHRVSGVNYSRDEVPADFADYTPDIHVKRGNRYAATLLHPTLGRMRVEHLDKDVNSVGNSIYYVDIAAAKAIIARGESVFEVFRSEDGSFTRLDISQLALGQKHVVTLENERIGDLPERVQSLRMLEALFSDARLMALGWLFAAQDALPRELGIFIDQLLRPIRNTPFGQRPPLTLLAAQDAAVIAYMDLTRTCNAMPELDRVLATEIDKFIDLHVNAEAKRLALSGHTSTATTWQQRGQSLKHELRIDTALRRELALVFLLAAHAMSSQNMSIFGIAWDFFKHIAQFGITSKAASERVADDARTTYRALRKEILVNDRLVQLATAMHAPQRVLGYVAQDEELAATHPETTEVGALQMKRVYNTLSDAVDAAETSGADDPQKAFSRVLVRAMDVFPEFGGALTIIGMLFQHLPLELSLELTAILHDYDAAESIKHPKDIEVFRKRFRSVYASHREVIRESLSFQTLDGISFSRHLTGMEYPWLGNTSWDLYSPAQRLFSFAPEFASTDPKRVAAYFEGLERRSRDPDLDPEQRQGLEASVTFAKLNPELCGALAMLPSMIDHVPGSFAEKIRTQFFRVPKGAWNDEELAARLVGSASQKVQPARAFVQLIIDHLTDVRSAISQPIPHMKGISAAEHFTGKKDPWKTNPADNGTEEEAFLHLLPLMDRVTTAGMELRELTAHIETRLWKLMLLPGNEKTLMQMMGCWEEKQEALIERGKLGLRDSEKLPRTLIKMMLAIEKTDILLGNKDKHPLTNEVTGMLAEANVDSHASMMHLAYAFMLQHREEIASASRLAFAEHGRSGSAPARDSTSKAGKKPGGNNGGANGAPSLPSSGSAAPAAPSASSLGAIPGYTAGFRQFGSTPATPLQPTPELFAGAHSSDPFVLSSELYVANSMTAMATGAWMPGVLAI